MKCGNCNFDNLGVEFIDVKDLDDDELRCEYCGTDLKAQLKASDKS